MKRIVGVLFSLIITLSLSACGNSVEQEKLKEISTVETAQPEKEQNNTIQKTPQEIETEKPENDSSVEQEADMKAKILVVYFSATGTTKSLAEYATEILNADLYEIIPEKPYTEEDLAYYTDGRADQKQSDPSVRPAISGGVENMDEYDTIILGYPIWHGQAPRIISTFLESYDISGKTIVPFCTSHSSGIGSSASNLHALCSDSVKWHEGRRFEAGTSKETIEEWLNEIW